jgi:prepilin-type N-terminal cleavage/methylation domain-containing protein
MIARPVYNKQKAAAGMTLPEIMVALAILGIVLSMCYGSSVALQRGFAATTSWADARTNQLRVLDSLAVDLRNAIATSFTTSADGLTNTLPLTLTIPMRYSAYETTGPLAGDPARSATVVNPGVNTTTRSGMQYSDTVRVTYRYGGSGTKRTIVRHQIDNNASREVSSFTNYSSASLSDPDNILKVTFTNKDMQLINSSDTAVVVRIEASPDSRHPENKSVLNDTVFLREATFK